MKTIALSPQYKPGFSLVELILTIAVVGILAGVLVMRTGSQSTAVSDIKLEADVRQLNQMVSLYRGDGGSVANLTRVADVMEKLRNSRSETTIKSHTGPVSGRLLDARLAPVMGTGFAGRKRAVWDPTKQIFRIVADTREGAFKFEIDSTRAAESGKVENRPGGDVVRFDGSKVPNWIWGAPTAQAVTPVRNVTQQAGAGQNNPFSPETPKSSGSGGGGGSGGGSGGGGGSPPAPPTPITLPTPTMSPSGGTYAYNSFPSSITIGSNGAPLGDSVLKYRKNGGAWMNYTGIPISVLPGDGIDAQNVPATGVTTHTAGSVGRNEYYRLVGGFTGGVQPVIGSVTGGSNLDYTVDTSVPGKIVFSHGNPEIDLGNGEVISTGEANVITITTQNFTTILPNQWFNVGDVSMLNGEIFNDSAADSVTLKLNFNLSDPAYTGSANVLMELINTPNSPDRYESADRVKLANPATNLVITIDGINYRLEVGWQNLDPATGVVSGNEFLIFEGGTATGRLRARFVSDR